MIGIIPNKFSFHVIIKSVDTLLNRKSANGVYLIQYLLASLQFVVPLHTFHIPVCHQTVSLILYSYIVAMHCKIWCFFSKKSVFILLKCCIVLLLCLE